MADSHQTSYIFWTSLYALRRHGVGLPPAKRVCGLSTHKLWQDMRTTPARTFVPFARTAFLSKKIHLADTHAIERLFTPQTTRNFKSMQNRELNVHL